MRLSEARWLVVFMLLACATKPPVSLPANDDRLKAAMSAFVRVSAGRAAIEHCEWLDTDRKAAFLGDYRRDMASLETSLRAQGMPEGKIGPVLDFLTSQGDAYARRHFADCDGAANDAAMIAPAEARCIPRFLADSREHCFGG